MAHATFQAGDIEAVIGDNSEGDGGHRAGYHGVWSLRHTSASRSLFVPAFAGLNLEHVFNGETEDAREYFFEPRTAPMAFQKLSDTVAELHQPPTPAFGLESRIRFTLSAPHYLDMHYSCIPHKDVFHRGWMGLFWASYIHAPEDKAMYFLGGLGEQSMLWTQFSTQYHNDQSTVRHRKDSLELDFANPALPALFKNVSRLRYDLPFFYGVFDDLVWIVMFDRHEGVRFSHSPAGGGPAPEFRTVSPAWDFQYIVPECKPLQSVEFRVRTVLRPRCTREDILKEYDSWK